jgi:hypothetical protein
LEIATGATGQGLKLGDIFQERQFDHPGGAVTLFGNDDFGHTWLFTGIFGVILIAVDEHDDVGVLLNGARLAQIAHHGTFVWALLHAAVELRQGDDRTLQFLGQHFEATGNFTEFGRTVFTIAAA